MTSKTINPIRAVANLRESYLRYLKTAFPIQDNLVRDEFWRSLEEPETLVKGPLLEATPDFVKGPSIQDLVNQGILNPAFANLCNPALPYDRPLYLHQSQAIEKAICRKRNLVISTGTGSGKTEAFLIPILNHLLDEREQGTLAKPGVRALMLYPMNALANDQIKRLRRILSDFPDIKFGRFIGETQNDYTNAKEQFEDQFPGEEILRNELISREQMRRTPPHLLLTNYAMLEYLLLRPEDNVFFDGPTAQHWRFIVLDEAHIYDGSLGIEIAMLLRRVKDRVVLSQAGKLQIFATSATIGTGKKDFPKVALFGENLFGETFEWQENDEEKQDVVEATRISLNKDEIIWKADDPYLYNSCHQVISKADSLDEIVRNLSVNCSALHDDLIDNAYEIASATNKADRINAFLFYLLRGNADVVALRKLLSFGPVMLSEAATQLFPETPGADQITVDLVSLAVKARKSSAASPLIPARYHVFARALEGAYLCLNYGHPKHKVDGHPVVSLKRQEKCPHCEAKMFEFSNCRQCGEIYIVGKEVKGELIPVETEVDEYSRIPPRYFILKPNHVDSDEDEIIVSGEERDVGIDTRTLCLICGDLQNTCECSPPARISIFEVKNQGNTLTRCVSCGKQKRGDMLPVSRVLTGQDAPVSVLAIALYQVQPPATDEAQYYPGEGRKLLIFSDSRQNAAFFAPYLEQRYTQFLQRRVIYQELISNQFALEGEARLEDVIDILVRRVRNEKWFSQRDSRASQRRTVARWIMQEMVSNDRYYSLESVGLVSFDFIFPDGWKPNPRLLDQLGVSADEGRALYKELFNVLRRNSVLRFPDEVDPKDDVFEPTNFIFTIRQSESDRKNFIFSWLPKSPSQNNRTDYLQKILTKSFPGIDPRKAYDLAYDLLTNIWREVTQNPRWQEHLYHLNLGGQLGSVFQIENWCWRILPTIQGNRPIYRCNTCNQVYHENVKGICPTYKCQGELHTFDRTDIEWKNNHFRYEYENMQVFPLQAEEHTAQWEHKTATQKQQDFVNGITNVLSCSTTFELGVDVGELQSVLMRNMPPTTANYIQRAGRAGRRIDSAALAVTFCQRRSHDLYYYSHPQDMVAGKIRPPIVNIENEKIIQRHIHSVVFAAFLRHIKQKYSWDLKTVQDFFFPNRDQENSPLDLFVEFVMDKPDEIKNALLRIVPASRYSALGVEDWGWVKKLYRSADDPELGDYALDRTYENVTSDILDIETQRNDVLEEIRSEPDNTRLPFSLIRFNDTLRTLQARRLFDVLSTHGVLPKYGFPVDVVEMKTRHLHFTGAKNIELDRDLQIAIAEYAPGSQVVAAKSVWTSGGIVKPFGKEWPVYQYLECKQCNQLVFALGAFPDICPYCEADLAMIKKRKFIIPEFGFVASRKQPKSSRFTRPTRSYGTTVYFAEYKMPNSETRLDLRYESVPGTEGSPLLPKKRYSHFGWIVAINEGKTEMGYRVCKNCGFAEPAPYDYKKVKYEHERPFSGKKCAGNFETYALAHRFMTDVLEIRFANLSGLPPELHTAQRSVLYAIIEGAVRALGIRRDDLDGTVYGRDLDQALIIYDRVPGGAGHAKRIAEELPVVFRSALEHVSHTCCGPETSCSECLRNYYNQRYHAKLQRGLALSFLERLLT